MITGANESLQDPARIGNGLKSIAINLSGIKTNAKTGALELNKTAKALQETAKIDIFTDSTKTQVKDIVTIMDEVKDKWASLTDVEQKGLSEAIAGKTQAGVFQALMTGWERVRQYQKEYNEGWMIGSAQREKQHSPYVQKCA